MSAKLQAAYRAATAARTAVQAFNALPFPPLDATPEARKAYGQALNQLAEAVRLTRHEAGMRESVLGPVELAQLRAMLELTP
jgi:hypothetical protein